MIATTKGVDPARMRHLLWAAQALTVLMMTALAWWLPGVIDPSPAPEAALSLIILAVVMVPTTVLLARLFGIGAADGAGYDARPRVLSAAPAAARSGVRGLGRYIVVLAAAETPAVLGLVYVLLGGPRPNALMLGAASLVLLLLYRPVQQHSGGGRPGSATRQ